MSSSSSSDLHLYPIGRRRRVAELNEIRGLVAAWPPGQQGETADTADPATSDRPVLPGRNFMHPQRQQLQHIPQRPSVPLSRRRQQIPRLQPADAGRAPTRAWPPKIVPHIQRAPVLPLRPSDTQMDTFRPVSPCPHDSPARPSLWQNQDTARQPELRRTCQARQGRASQVPRQIERPRSDGALAAFRHAQTGRAAVQADLMGPEEFERGTLEKTEALLVSFQ